ncbi:hypothetical protein BT96DRAFT_939239 [Gymnopus androsaceus JB14]|uniref:DUF6535 domain-containing protein n=1 Tax=Gymnopus androsaceus JB14 TaxID=1447944 RepID=A0A6A4HPT6_9AGAR|nr:hypothetical protein BT96DRAFT_939239 [Gymnopus androsaceus JB14]
MSHSDHSNAKNPNQLSTDSGNLAGLRRSSEVGDDREYPRKNRNDAKHTKFKVNPSDLVDEENWKEGKGMVEQMWAIHLKHDSDVEKEVQRWKGTAEGILIFTGLFSATVATFIIEVYKSLLPDPSGGNAAILQELVAQRAILAHIASTNHWARRYERLCNQKLEFNHSPDKQARLRLRLISSVATQGVPHFCQWTVALAILVLQLAFALLYVFFTLFQLFQEVSVFQTPVTAVIWKFLATLTAAYLTIKTFIIHVWLKKQAGESFWVRLNVRLTSSPHRFMHEFRNAVEWSSPSNVTLSDSELKGVLSTFEVLRIANVSNGDSDSAGDFDVFLIGICSLLSSDSDDVGYRIARQILDSPSSSHPGLFTTWESWLITILQQESLEDSENFKLMALCMRIHMFILLHYPSAVNTVFDRLSGWSFFEKPILQSLQKLQRHSRLSVAISARCFQAILAADMHTYRYKMDHQLFWSFVSPPNPEIPIETLSSYIYIGDRSLLVIMGLVKDVIGIMKRHKESQTVRENSHRVTDREVALIHSDVTNFPLEEVLPVIIKSMEVQIQVDPPMAETSSAFRNFFGGSILDDCYRFGIVPAISSILEIINEAPLPSRIGAVEESSAWTSPQRPPLQAFGRSMVNIVRAAVTELRGAVAKDEEEEKNDQEHGDEKV